jgi:CopG family nickel-responsive transcriptional regulator
VKEKWDENKIVAGSITIVYDHHKKDVLNKLTDVSHDYHDVILSSQHFHLNHDSCLEIIVVKGKSKLLKELSDKIIALKGIAHGKLTMTDA